MSALFRNDQQRAAVCEALCAKAGLVALWTTNDGPSEKAKQLLTENGRPMSTGERIMFLAAWAIWNGEGTVLLADVIERLDDSNLETVGTLLVALAQGGIESWLEEQRRRSA